MCLLCLFTSNEEEGKSERREKGPNWKLRSAQPVCPCPSGHSPPEARRRRTPCSRGQTESAHAAACTEEGVRPLSPFHVRLPCLSAAQKPNLRQVSSAGRRHTFILRGFSRGLLPVAETWMKGASPLESRNLHPHSLCEFPPDGREHVHHPSIFRFVAKERREETPPATANDEDGHCPLLPFKATTSQSGRRPPAPARPVAPVASKLSVYLGARAARTPAAARRDFQRWEKKKKTSLPFFTRVLPPWPPAARPRSLTPLRGSTTSKPTTTVGRTDGMAERHTGCCGLALLPKKKLAV